MTIQLDLEDLRWLAMGGVLEQDNVLIRTAPNIDYEHFGHAKSNGKSPNWAVKGNDHRKQIGASMSTTDDGTQHCENCEGWFAPSAMSDEAHRCTECWEDVPKTHDDSPKLAPGEVLQSGGAELGDEVICNG